MTRHYPDLGSASEWSCRVGNLIQPIRSTTQIWVVTRHQYGISALVSQTLFGGETSGSVAKCWLFSQAKFLTADQSWPWYTVSGPEQEFRRWFADEIKFRPYGYSLYTLSEDRVKLKILFIQGLAAKNLRRALPLTSDDVQSSQMLHFEARLRSCALVHWVRRDD